MTPWALLVGVLPMGPPGALPAYLDPRERPPITAAAGDLRAAYPERYALTVPPSMPALRPHTAWDPVDAVVLSVPVTSLAPGDVRAVLADVGAAVAPVARLIVLHDGSDARQSFAVGLSARGVPDDAVTWVDTALDSVWQADYGPWSILDDATETQAFADFRYFDPRPNDDAVPTVLGERLGASTYRFGAKYEGGNVLADAAGRCYSTQRGLAQSGQSEADLVAGLRAYLGCSEVVWLWDLPEDRTGHVDMVVMLPSPGHAVVGQVAEAGAARDRMDENAAALSALGLEVARLPMPGAVVVDSGFTKEAVPFTYANAALVNGVLAWPRYAQPGWEAVEAEAAAVWAAVLPDAERVPITSDALALLSGAVHCVIRTITDVPPARWVPDGACAGGRCAPVDGFEALSYDGPCLEERCSGPRWSCGCNDCSAPCPASAPCPGDLTVFGCCDGDTVRWCDGGRAQEKACAPGSCGWDPAAGWYACGTDGAVSGDHPAVCGAAPETPDDDTGSAEPSPTADAGPTVTSTPASDGCTAGPRPGGFGLLAILGLACHMAAQARRPRRGGARFSTSFRIGRPRA